MVILSVQQMLDTFERMPEAEKKEFAAEILRRTSNLEYGPLSDEELTLNAEQIFLELDRQEAASDKS